MEIRQGPYGLVLKYGAWIIIVLPALFNANKVILTVAVYIHAYKDGGFTRGSWGHAEGGTEDPPLSCNDIALRLRRIALFRFHNGEPVLERTDSDPVCQ